MLFQEKCLFKKYILTSAKTVWAFIKIKIIWHYSFRILVMIIAPIFWNSIFFNNQSVQNSLFL